MIILLTIALYMLITQFITIKSKKTAKMLENLLPAKKTLKQKIYDASLGVMEKEIAKHIKLEEYKRNRLERDLKKARYDSSITTEIFTARGYVYAIVSIFSALAFVFLGQFFGPVFYIPMFASIAITPLAYVMEKDKVNRMIKEINEKIEAEIPQLYSFYTSSLETTKNTIKILTDYKEIAGDDFQYDLDVVISDMETGNHEDALNRFADRLNINILYDFIRGVIAVEKGSDQRQYFQNLKNEMIILEREYTRRRALKVPAKIKLAIIPVVIMGAVKILHPLVRELITSEIFKF